MKKSISRMLVLGIGIIMMVMLVGCGEDEEDIIDTCYCEDDGSQIQVTINGIPASYNSKFAFVTFDVNNKDVGWAMINSISNNTITAHMACWEHNEPFTRNGNYRVFILISEDDDSIDTALYYGGTGIRQVNTDSITVEWSAFSDYTDTYNGN